MGADKENLIDNMHQIVYEVLKTSFEEADAGGFCTEISQVQICVYIHLPAMLVRLCCLYLQEI